MSTIYVLKEGQKNGPFTTEELEGKVEAGVYSRDDLYWIEGMEEWQPLAAILEVEVTSPDESAEEEEDILFDGGDAVVTPHAIRLPGGEEIPLLGIARVEVQSEKVRRFRPAVGCIIVGVLAVCLALIEIPRTTVTHWTLWGVVLLFLVLWWLRLLLVALRSPAAMVVIDLHDGDERIVRPRAASAEELCGAINQARGVTG